MYKHKKANNTIIPLKFQHRRNCFNKLKAMKIIPVKEFGLDSTNEAILIEFRILPHLEYLVRNTINLLDESWNHTIVCGDINYKFIENMCSAICKKNNSRINVIKLDRNNINVMEYNQMLYKINFWQMFKGEKLLIYQEDTLMFHGNINPFLKYDYVGAPWPESLISKDPTHYCFRGGNGGFSLRSKSKIIECLEKNGIHTVNEDYYFSSYIKNVCPRELSKEFSQEYIKGDTPLGGHCYWNVI